MHPTIDLARVRRPLAELAALAALAEEPELVEGLVTPCFGIRAEYRQQMAHEHWKYFLALEVDLHTIARYVEPAAANFDTYSIEVQSKVLAMGFVGSWKKSRLVAAPQ